MINKNIFTIAEIGINHNGDINIAKKLILEAHNAGFDSVKFQKRNINKVYTQKFLDSFRESPWGTTQRQQKEGLEFNLSDYKIIDDYCKNLGIKWFASAWDEDSLDFFDQFNLKYQKIASPMIVDKSFLAKAAKKNKYTFISTGMSSNSEIETAVKIFKDAKSKFELMHCVSIYPLKPEMANLETINSLRNKYQCNVGYSGHEVGLAVSYAACMMGITSLERHITLDRSMYGSDQSASIEPKGMKDLIKNIKIMQSSMGENVIGKIYEQEKENAKKLREHIKNN